MKHTLVLSCAGILSLAAASAQTTTPTPKPGSIGTVTYSATLTGQNPVTSTTIPGGVRKKYTATSFRFSNREILLVMAGTGTSGLLDGTIAGWSIVRLAGVTDTGNLYAVKNGKTAVAVPTTLLTQPVVTGVVKTGTVTTPTTGTETNAYTTKAYGTATVQGGLATVSGTQTVKTLSLKIGTATTLVQAHTDSFTVIGQAKLATGATLSTGTINSSYKLQNVKAANLVALLPGTATP